VSDVSNPAGVAQQAITQAAHKFAPGLVNGHSATEHKGRHGGRWVRRGDRIILFGV